MFRTALLVAVLMAPVAVTSTASASPLQLGNFTSACRYYWAHDGSENRSTCWMIRRVADGYLLRATNTLTRAGCGTFDGRYERMFTTPEEAGLYVPFAKRFIRRARQRAVNEQARQLAAQGLVHTCFHAPPR